MVGREQRGPQAPYPPPPFPVSFSLSHSSLQRVQKQQRAPYATRAQRGSFINRRFLDSLSFDHGYF